MNIFVLHRNPYIAAEMHNNSHVCKQVLESAQILSTCLHLRGEQGPYKITHKNHPCVRWANENEAHYSWLFDLYTGLYMQYTLRYKKIHACQRLSSILVRTRINYDNIDFVQAMPKEYQCADAVIAYRRYYLWDKRHLARWKIKTPSWYIADDLT